MAANQVFEDSDELSLPVGTGVKSGEPVRVGLINGIALTDSGDLLGNGTGATKRSNIPTSNASGFATVKTNGVWHVQVVVGADAAAGDPVYIKGDRTLTTVATSAKLWGTFTRAVTAGTKRCAIAIVPTSV